MTSPIPSTVASKLPPLPARKMRRPYISPTDEQRIGARELDPPPDVIVPWSDEDMHAYAESAIALAEKRASDAARDVLAERERQKSVEGWTPEHDDEHADGSMARAAAVYALYDLGVPGALQVHALGGALWPWDFMWLKPKGERRNLVRAGALILAEIERLDRAAIRSITSNTGG